MYRCSRRRSCGKCGKAEAFLAQAFPSSLWKSLRRSCRRPLHWISTAAAFSTALDVGRLVGAAEEPDIRNGKNPSQIRSRFQTASDRPDRSRPVEFGAGGAGLSDRPQRAGTLARAVSPERPGGSSIEPRAGTGSRERETAGQDRRSGDADGPFKKIADLGSTAEKRRYIRDHRQELGSVSQACQVTGLAASSFYYKPNPQHRRRREKQDEKLRQQIEQIHEEFTGYGYRRIANELARRGLRVNEKRIRRVMKKFDLKPITWRTWVATTDSAHALAIHPNRIQNRQVRAINEVWVADITYIRIRSSFVYLAAIMDLYSRRIVGWAISRRIDTELCLMALRMALETRSARGCIHHSDRGAQYASASYVALLQQHGLQISMSAKGN